MLNLTNPIVTKITRNKDLRVIYVFSTDPYASFHVNYEKFANFIFFWVMEAVKFFHV